ncbi:MAG: SGNH/GDSL hydrolase family protein [Ruminococcaceae bacterium]|nr:SGNH/GDSL hydrolase family protein [Oscillospiraceae bacterium]
MDRERWYPLTYPGFYGADLSEEISLRCERCRLELSHFREQTVDLHTSGETEGVCTLTDGDGNILKQWENPPETLLVPREASYLYLNNDYAANPDFYVLVPAGVRKKENAFLFDENFADGASLDGNDFLGEFPAKHCTSEGLVLPSGIENALVLNKSTALDDWCLTAECTAQSETDSVCLGTRITQGRPCKHASLCCVDLAADELRLYRGSKGDTMPEEVLQTASLGGMIPKGEFILRLERVNLAIRATVINPRTGGSVSVTQPIMEQETESTVAGGCKAGKMFDSPQVFALSGAPRIRRLYGAAKASPKVVFFGDSITQGAHNLPENGWAQKCAADIGSSICCGRGSGDIWSCLNQVRTLAPILRPKAMVVTIGGNNREDTTSTETVKGLYEKFIRIAEALGIILILNCTTSSLPHAAETNRVIRSLGALGSRFDLALVEGHTEGGKRIEDYFVSDGVHLNAEGNVRLYNLFMKDFSWLKNL